MYAAGLVRGEWPRGRRGCVVTLAQDQHDVRHHHAVHGAVCCVSPPPSPPPSLPSPRHSHLPPRYPHHRISSHPPDPSATGNAFAPASSRLVRRSTDADADADADDQPAADGVPSAEAEKEDVRRRAAPAERMRRRIAARPLRAAPPIARFRNGACRGGVCRAACDAAAHASSAQGCWSGTGAVRE
jgi:hypothetical protein